MDGIAATQTISALCPAVRVLVVTTFDTDDRRRPAHLCRRTLLKNVEPTGLTAGIRTVLDGDALVAPEVTRALIEYAVPVDLRRPGAGPDPHVHRSISEQFYVLSGQVRLFDGRFWVTAGPGDFLYVPEGGVHGFRGGGRAWMLLMFAPGGPREDYFETLARGEPMTEEQRASFMMRHDTHWV